jgi:hypothetical protein
MSDVRLFGLDKGVVTGDKRTVRAYYTIRCFPEMSIR